MTVDFGLNNCQTSPRLFSGVPEVILVPSLEGEALRDPDLAEWTRAGRHMGVPLASCHMSGSHHHAPVRVNNQGLDWLRRSNY